MFFILVYDIETAIIAASVDDDMFGVFLRILIYDAFYRLFQSAFIVIVDGDDGARWSSDFADNAWACIDLGKTYEINNMVLKWEAAYATEYRIEISNDGASWTTAKTLNNQTGGTTTVSLNGVKA